MTNNKQRTCGTLLHSLTHFRFHHNLLSGSSLDVVPPKDPGTTTSNNPLPHLPHPVVFSLQQRPGPPLALACLLVLQGQHLHFLPVLYSFGVLVLLVLVSFGSKTRKYKPTTKHTSTSDSFDGPTLPQPPALLAASQHYQYVPREANHCTRSDGRRTDVMRQILVPLRTIDRSFVDTHKAFGLALYPACLPVPIFMFRFRPSRSAIRWLLPPSSAFLLWFVILCCCLLG